MGPRLCYRGAMHSTVAFDVFMLAGGALVVGLLVWMLVDGFRTGRMPFRGGGTLDRRKHPMGFWLMTSLGTVLLCVVCVGYGTVFVDLFWR